MDSEAGRYHMNQLRSQLTGLPRRSAVVVHSLRRAVVEQDALLACSTERTDAVVVLAKNLAVLAEYLAPMVFKLLLGLTGAALMLAEGPATAPGDANVALLSLLMSSAVQLAEKLLTCHQSAGEECLVEIDRFNKKAEQYASGKHKEAQSAQDTQTSLARDAAKTKESANFDSAVSIGSGIGALAVAALASGPVGWAAFVIAGGTVVVKGVAAAEKDDKVKQLTEQAAKCKKDQSVLEEDAAKGHAAVEALEHLTVEVGPELDASNSTVTGLLTTALCGLLSEWELMWDAISSELHTAGSKADAELLPKLRSLFHSIKVAAKDWDCKVRGAACGLVRACGVPADVNLLKQFLETYKYELSQKEITVEQGYKITTDINKLPSNNMAGQALGLYMKKNTQLLLEGITQTVPELLEVSEEAKGPEAGHGHGKAAAY